jgi:hypothetical protein
MYDDLPINMAIFHSYVIEPEGRIWMSNWWVGHGILTAWGTPKASISK